MKKVFALLSLAVVLGFTGCSAGGNQAASGTTVSKEDYDKLKEDLDTANSKTKELESEVAALKEQLETAQVDKGNQEEAKTEAPVEEGLSAKELEAKLKEQPIYVVSTEYFVQSDEYKALYPDMLNAVFKNVSGKEIKNVTIAFAGWDDNKMPVKIVGQFDFDNGSYIQQVAYDDVNMVDGAEFGKDTGYSLSEKSDTIKTVKAIVTEYTDFDGNTWENPYYNNWISVYENKKLGK
ncbi:DUF5780 domain-containing protein [Clostridium sp. KNHs205]|uniref:DUF5780 domain-containing protein n=1 Tax=Clostridium sp. KNHs205 TaxID=1449050 RepID=UPI00068D7DD2|nr:DUF5780 domain-containing protein [Clostridium sp. KNHs205]